MKKFTIFLALFLSMCFVACDFGYQKVVEDKGSVTVVVNGEEQVVYNINLEDLDLTDGALSLMVYLKDTKGLDVVYTDSIYGAYFTKIGDIATDDNGYLCILTSYEDEWDRSIYSVEADYLGTKVVSSSVGISSMSVVDGVIIYFTYVAY